MENKLKKIILILVIGLLMASIVSSTHKEEHKDKDINKKNKDKVLKNKLIKNKINTNDEKKLFDYYSKRFYNVNEFKHYVQDNNITIISVTTNNGNASIITHTSLFNEVTK